jgi:hypothetical protein
MYVWMMRPNGLDLRQTYRDGQHVSAVYQNVIISYSLAEPTSGYMQSWVQTIGTLAREGRGGVASIIIIDGVAKPPSDEVRVEIKQAIAKAGPHLRALAQVVEGTGFTAAAKRSALSFISLVARFPFPIKIFSTRREAAAWVKERLHDPSLGPSLQTLTVDELARACDAVCAEGSELGRRSVPV